MVSDRRFRIFVSMKPLMKYHVEFETQDGRKLKTWGVLPVLNTTKVLDGIYDPDSKMLRLLIDSTAEQYVDFPIQVPKTGKWDVQQRKMFTYYKGKISHEDIQFFLDTYVDNNFEFKEPSSLILPEEIENAPVTLIKE